MTTVTLNSLRNEAISNASPQLAAADAFAAHGGDITLELADLTVGQLSAVAALMLSLDAAVARARAAEHKLAEHVRHCICCAAELAEGGPSEAASAFVAEACDAVGLKIAA
jgi:hypothetical protein